MCLLFCFCLCASTALDAWENESIPKVSIDCNNLYFDQLEYKTMQKKTITITNIGKHLFPGIYSHVFCWALSVTDIPVLFFFNPVGKVGATFRFVPKLEGNSSCTLPRISTSFIVACTMCDDLR